jgi:ATP-binding cassette subfamily C (CFTR/MRP) protein 1
MYIIAEAKMVSVERIEQYSYLPAEPPLSFAEPKGKQVVPRDWPSKGAIEFNNVTMSYRDGLEPALRNMSVIIHGTVPSFTHAYFNL